jgi:hypothetical protein
LDDLQKGNTGVPQGADLPRVFVNLPRVFENRSALLDNLPRLFLTLAKEKFHRLRQRFVPLGQAIKPFINRHKSPARFRPINFDYRRVPPLTAAKIKPTHCAV